MTTADPVEPTAPRDTTARRSAVSVRERLLAAADELFYAEGIQRTGVDRVIERAGAAKASLYNTFGSKDALVAAYLQGRDEALRSQIELALARYETPRAKMLGVFSAQAESFADPSYRGCAFVYAQAEPTPISTAATTVHRAWVQQLFTELAGAAGAANPAALARQLHILFDGTALLAGIDRDAGAAKSARLAATALIDIAIDGPAQRKAGKSAKSGKPVAAAKTTKGQSEKSAKAKSSKTKARKR